MPFTLCLLAVLLWFSDACFLMFIDSSVVFLCCMLPYVCWQLCCSSLMPDFGVRVSVTFHLMFVGCSGVVL